MSDRIFIKPTPQPEGQPPLKVRKPVNGHLSAAGEWVNAESYWLRRIADGDVMVDKDAVEPTEAPATKTAKPARA